MFLRLSRVLRLEDPIEDTFCDLISTERGNYRIVLGRWEEAAAYTQTVLDAFAALPEHALKTDALTASHALLALSDALCERAKLSRGGDSGGEAMGEVKLGSKDDLNALARRVRFSSQELDQLGIDIGALAPFFINEDYYQYVSDRPIGDTPLEFHPLLQVSDGVCILSPSNLSIAVRAALINTALEGGAGAALQHRLLEAQARYSEETGFWPAGQIRLSPPNAYNIRACVCQYDHGHYLHVVQIPTVFDGFPQHAFASFRQLPKEASESVITDIKKFWTFLEERGDCRSSKTILLLSGWGAPRGFDLKLNDVKAPGHWTYLVLSFKDAAVLGACHNGGLTNVLRLHEQVQRMESDGFTFTNPNGLLNLFSCWRETDGNIVPEHMSEIAPPCDLVLGVGEIHAPRMEALEKQDRRALPTSDGPYKIVQRKDWAEGPRYPIYASVEDAKCSRLVGAVSLDQCTVWIASETQDGVPRDWQYQIWNAILQWLGETGPKILGQHPNLYRKGACEISVVLPKHEGKPGAVDTKEPSTTLEDSVELQPDATAENLFTVTVKKGWMKHLSKPENAAEIELIASIFQAMVSDGSRISRDEVREHVRMAIGSKNWRWLHAREIIDPVPRLGAQGLIGRFVPLPLSAHALVTYG